jgi:hypothetical protein
MFKATLPVSDQTGIQFRPKFAYMVGLHIFWAEALKFGARRQSAPQDPERNGHQKLEGLEDLSVGIVPVPKCQRQLFVDGRFERKTSGVGSGPHLVL